MWMLMARGAVLQSARALFLIGLLAIEHVFGLPVFFFTATWLFVTTLETTTARIGWVMVFSLCGGVVYMIPWWWSWVLIWLVIWGMREGKSVVADHAVRLVGLSGLAALGVGLAVGFGFQSWVWGWFLGRLAAIWFGSKVLLYWDQHKSTRLSIDRRFMFEWDRQR